MRYLKAACGFLCFLVLASNVWSMSHWNEARGVYDDVCYLRQAHLLAFFISHPVFTPYYMIPIAMLSLWTLLFASLMQPAEAVDHNRLGQAAKA